MNMDNGGIMIKNYQILKESIHGMIQNSGLDIGAVYFVLKDIFSEVENLYYAQLNKECLEEAEKTKSERESSKENNDTDNQ